MVIMVGRYALHVLPVRVPSHPQEQWTVSWHIDDVQRLNKRMKEGVLKEIFPTSLSAVTAGRQVAVVHLDMLLGRGALPLGQSQ